MNKIWTIIKREYKEAVFKKSFIIMTILTPLIMVGLGVIPSLLIMVDTEKALSIDVIDESGFVFQPFVENMKDTLEDGSSRFQFRQINTESGYQEVLAAEKLMIENESIDGLLVIPAGISEQGEIEYYTKNVANLHVNRLLRQTVNDIVSENRILKSGLEPDLVNKLTQNIDMKTIKIVKGGVESERGFMDEYFSTFIFVLILYLTLILYGTSIMRSIVQEKTSRVIEVMLSGVNPYQLMFGKILGQGSVGLTQYIIWAAFGIGLVLFGGSVVPISSKYFNFSPMIFIYFVIFYILGYFLFSVLYAAVGAVTNNDTEAQQMSMPIIMLLIVPIMLIGFLVNNPDSTVAVTLSLIPFFSPIIMFARINLTTPPFYEIFGSIGLLIITIIFLIWMVAKIYRVGILMYGKRPTMPEILKWLRYK